MSITADPLFVAAEAQWRRERLTVAFHAPEAPDDDVLAARDEPYEHEHPQDRLRRLVGSLLRHRHAQAAPEPEPQVGAELTPQLGSQLEPGSRPDSEVVTRAA